MTDEGVTQPMDSDMPNTDEPATTEETGEPTDSEPGAEGSPFTDVEPYANREDAASAEQEGGADQEGGAEHEAGAEQGPDAEHDGSSEHEPGAEAAPEDAAPIPLELYFIRHADAGDPMAWEGNDADRPLSKKGRRQAKRLGDLLDDLDLLVDAVVTSPRVRAADTARIVAKSIGAKARVDDRLSIDFGEDALAGLVASWEPDVRRVILVGHDPDFTHLVSWLAGASITMRKGALARIDLVDRTVGASRGSVRWLLPPDAVAG